MRSHSFQFTSTKSPRQSEPSLRKWMEIHSSITNDQHVIHHGKIGHILLVIHYSIYGAVCFQFTQFPRDGEYIALSYYHHQIGSMNYYPFFMVRSWNNGMRWVALYILYMVSCPVPDRRCAAPVQISRDKRIRIFYANYVGWKHNVYMSNDRNNSVYKTPHGMSGRNWRYN